MIHVYKIAENIIILSLKDCIYIMENVLKS